ncbi:MAG TPA: hypothetical protein VNI57_10355, partial [Candidatus Saccharimonadales bacterium]|nr:hypothetical protein [Candidatus Saccharimonadales bacterium]
SRAPAGPSTEAGGRSAIAVLPFVNLGGPETPLPEVRARLLDKLAERHVPVLGQDELDAFMRRNRMRYTGGLSGEMGRALAQETGAGAALVTSIDLYVIRGVPKAAMTSRLVSAGEAPQILWMDSAAFAGDQAPGFLRIGELPTIDPVIDRVAERIADSLAAHLSGAADRQVPFERLKRRFRPVKFFRSAVTAWGASHRPRVAVLPFSNGTPTGHAGEITTLQLVRFLADSGDVELLEPGVVRQTLLKSRFIQQEGPSIPQSDLLHTLLDADIVIFGEVDEYQDATSSLGEPVVGFTVRAIDTARRQVIWSSVSYGRGGDGVFFFGLGKVATAQALASEMARGLVGTILKPSGGSS